MATFKSRLAVDLANVYDKLGEKPKILTTFAWGDEVEIVNITDDHIEVRITRLKDDGENIVISKVNGFIKRPSKTTKLTTADVAPRGTAASAKAARRVLRCDFVDVQQGDGAVIETPKGRVMLIDGGDNQLFARYLAARFGGTSAAKPKSVDCIVVTHGDADHFLGLAEIRQSETHTTASKRLFIHPDRIYHNGLVKRPEKKNGVNRKETEMLGATRTKSGDTYVVGLVNDPRDVDTTEQNTPFRAWTQTLDHWETRGEIEMRRLEYGDGDAFDFLSTDKVKVEVVGPLTEDVSGQTALRFLREPPPRFGTSTRKGSYSAGHTINGHSIILRLTYGKFRMLFAGDLNEEAEHTLSAEHAAGRIDLTSEVLKVPHHGSADYSPEFVRDVSPLISVVSSGDESERKEYIHPRATLVGALGRYSRESVREPLIFVTELAAFFAVEGPAVVTDSDGRKKNIFAFSRRAFGIIKVRTDGQRILVYTYSGKDDLKEAYAFRFEGDAIVPDIVRKC